MSGREAGSSGWPAGGGLTPRVGGEEARPPSRNPRLQGGAIRGGEALASRQGQTPRVPSAKGGKQGPKALKETRRPRRAQEGAPCSPHMGVPELGKSPLTHYTIFWTNTQDQSFCESILSDPQPQKAWEGVLRGLGEVQQPGSGSRVSSTPSHCPECLHPQLCPPWPGAF